MRRWGPVWCPTAAALLAPGMGEASSRSRRAMGTWSPRLAEGSGRPTTVVLAVARGCAVAAWSRAGTR
jgi:hypothetical protein